MPNDSVEDFLDGDVFAVVGASRERTKYGNKVLRAYIQAGLKAFPVNPKEAEVEGLKCYPTLQQLSEALSNADPEQKLHGVSIITQPIVTEKIVSAAIQLGVKHVWMQPGAESKKAMNSAEANGLNLIAGGPCILVRLGYRE